MLKAILFIACVVLVAIVAVTLLMAAIFRSIDRWMR